ncbi:energy transducer TonB [Mucilaginibacter sp. McL0603]|uniref:energy transducer TonB n=1 Tax=Mucilaginibacter sp. McL0603 TaxID=3415670 RepID=UPI003CFA005A
MSWWQYLLLVNLYLVLFYGFYTLLLRRETFFHLNRIYLVSSALLSFFIPVIHSDWVKNLFITQKVQHTIALYSAPIMVYHIKSIEEHHFTIGQILTIVYSLGAAVLIIKFIWQLVSLKKVIDEPEESGAFSFFKSIRLGTNSGDQTIIVAHEQVHADQWHSADVILIEIVAIINWFNPVVYYYRFGIKHIHEFIADRRALDDGVDIAEYAMLLLSQTIKAPTHQLVNPFFNHSLLKQRIIMLQKNRSHYISLLKYCLLVPLFVLMLVLSSVTISKSKTIRLINKKIEEMFSTPATSVKTVIVNRPAPPVPAANIIKDSVESTFTLAEDKEPNKTEEDHTLMTVEVMPEFKGGISEFYNFLSKNLQYTDAMLQKNIQGKVFISLTVEKDGSLTDIKAVKDIGGGAAAAAIRVLKLSPKWEPGYQNGQKVRVRYTLPINFTIVNGTLKDTASAIVSNKESSDYKPVYTAAPKDTVRTTGTTIIGLDTQMNPLFVLDGKEIANLNNLDPNTIESLRLVKSSPEIDGYVDLYGKKALNGVVVISTKISAQK